MVSLERIRRAVSKSGHTPMAIFEKLSCGRGAVFRPEFENLASRLDPGISDADLYSLWQQTGKASTGALLPSEFVQLFSDQPAASQAPGLVPSTSVQPTAQVAQLASPALPPLSLMLADSASDWVQHVDALTQRTFYHSISLGQSSWTDPRPASVPPASTVMTQGDWVECNDPPTGRTFFYSAFENRSSWTDPRAATIAQAPTLPQVSSVAPNQVSDWVEIEDPVTLKRYFYSALQRRTTWTDRRFEQTNLPSLLVNTVFGETIIGDDRFKQLLEYISQVLQMRGQTAARYFDAADLNRDGYLNVDEFTRGLTDLGANGVDRSELRKVFQRIEGSGSEFALARVIQLADAITDSVGFMARARVGQGKAIESIECVKPIDQIDDARFRQLLEYFNQVLQSRGQFAPSYFQLLDLNRDGRLSSDEFINGLMSMGANGVDRSEIQKVFRRIEGSGSEFAQALVSSIAEAITDSAGFMSRAQLQGSKNSNASNKIEDGRFKQLSEYFSQLLQSHNRTAASYFQYLDLDRDYRLTRDEFIKGLTELGVNGVDHLELQGVFQRIDGSGSDSAKALVSSVADAITDPAGFLIRAASRVATANSITQRMSDSRCQQLLEYVNQLLNSRYLAAAQYFDSVDADRDGLISNADFYNALVQVGVNGIDSAELTDVFTRIEGSGSASSRALVSSVVDAITDPAGFLIRTAASPQFPAVSAASQSVLPPLAPLVPPSQPQQLPVAPLRPAIPQRITVQLRTSPLKKLGFGASKSNDGKVLSITRIDQVGLLADFNADQKWNQKIQVGDQIIEVNGRSANADELSVALQTQGLLTIIVSRGDQLATATGSQAQADPRMSDARFKQLLEYFAQILQSRAQTAASYFESLDADRDCRLSIDEFIKGLSDLGVNGIERAELQIVFQRIDGSVSESSKALVSSVVNAIVDPAGFLIRIGGSKSEARKCIADARFKQLLEYLAQVLQSRGQDVARYLEALDLNRDGCLSRDEFIDGLTAVGANGVDRLEFQNIFKRIEGSGSDSAQALVSMLISAVTDPAGFISRTAKKMPAVTFTFRFNVQLRPSAFKKLGMGASPSSDGSTLVVTRVDGIGLIADWNAGQRFSQKVQVGDHVVEVNGRSANTDDLVSGLQSSGPLSIVFARSDNAGSTISSKLDAKKASDRIDDTRLKQLLDYFSQVFQSRGQIPARYFEALDLNRDGRLSSTEFSRGLADIGVNNVEPAEMQKVFQRIEGSGLDFAQALVSSVADAISDPAAFLARALLKEVSVGNSSPDIRKKIDDARFKQLLDYFHQVAQNRGQTVSRYFASLDLNRDGRLSFDEFSTGLYNLGVTGVERAEMQKVFGRIEGTGSDLAQVLVSSVVEAITDSAGFIERSAKRSSAQPVQSTTRITVQLRPSALKKLGMGASPTSDGRRLSVTRIDGAGLIADWNAGQRWSQKVQIGDQIVEVNGRGSSADELASALQSQGSLTIVFVRSDEAGTGGSQLEQRATIDDTRFKQLLEYFAQVLRNRGQHARAFFESIDTDKDGCLSSDEFIRNLIDIGVNGVGREEIQRLYQRIEGTGLESAKALVGSIADAVTDPAGFIAREKARLEPKKVPASKSEARDMKTRKVLDSIARVLRNRGRTAARFFESIDLNRDGRLSRDEFVRGLLDAGVTEVDRVDLQKVFHRIEGSGSELAQALVSSVVDAVNDPSAFLARAAQKTLAPQTSYSTRITVQVLPSVLKKLGAGTSPSPDSRALTVLRIDNFGLLADWNAGQKRSSERVQVGDQIVEVNGRSGNADDLTRALQSQGMLTIVFARPDHAGNAAGSKVDLRASYR